MKKTIILVFTLVFAIFLQGCNKPKEKTFSKIGVEITLNDSFIEKEVIQAPFYLESTSHIFMAIREEKSTLSPFGITTLQQYIDAVIENSGKDVETFEKTEGDVVYLYAYYTSLVGDQNFGYMLLTFMGEDHFYTMNFGCLESKLEDNKEQYFDWAKTIIVE